MDTEADITINGTRLTEGQAMTVRVALSDLAASLFAGGLGDDEHGKRMTDGYQKRLTEIFALMQN